ncbi:unnamed protein product [Mytilus edulis]|uniref:Uncharacterized protein n=1 Tax=Mytilus edulis TaxID=6550 RepID=A0A8S3Q5L3_MYTED|nr:unnamed protein product [Mytilus edulis]
MSNELVFRIILHVGGNPLQVIPFGDTYMVSSNCTEGMLDCPLMNQQFSSPSNVQKGSWTQWSLCTKSCNIGTQTRCRYNNVLQKTEYEEQYCNTQYCPGEDLSCNTTTDCPIGLLRLISKMECENNVCRCALGDGHNKYNCFGEVGNCVIREKSQIALGYAPSESYLFFKSCTTNDNSRYELHVISTYSGDPRVFEITIRPRGPVIKPIVLVLMSESIIWKINTPVGLYKVFYEGRDHSNRTVVKVVKNSSSKCSFEATKRSDIAYNIWKITSTMRHSLAANRQLHLHHSPSNQSQLHLQGSIESSSPLVYLQWRRSLCEVYDVSAFSCVLVTNDASRWGSWRSCTKTCGIGTQIRQRLNSTGDVYESETQYCNTQPCAAQKGTCAILKNPPTSIGYKDPSVKYSLSYDNDLYSCTTNDNPKYEVHVVSLPRVFSVEIHEFEILIVPRGPVVKPIILVLTFSGSYFNSHLVWKIETPVGINKVLYGGSSTVENKSSSKCDFRVFQKLDLEHRYGVLPHGYTYKLSSNCTEGMLDCPLMNPQPTAISSGVQTDSWTQWSSCTKTCDIGTQSRCRYNNTNQNIEYEEQYCNTQYCPGI